MNEIPIVLNNDISYDDVHHVLIVLNNDRRMMMSATSIYITMNLYKNREPDIYRIALFIDNNPLSFAIIL